MRTDFPVPAGSLLAGVVCALALHAAGAATITNGGFESGLSGWRSWTREQEMGTLALDSAVFHSGHASARWEHRGQRDWSLEPLQRLDTQPGDVWELEVWLKGQGAGTVTLCVSSWDARKQPVEWSLGASTARPRSDWQKLRSRFVVPQGVTQIQPRLIGDGQVAIWVDDYSITKQFNVQSRRGDFPAELSLGQTGPGGRLTLRLNTAEGTMSVFDRAAGRTWRQRALSPEVIVTKASQKNDRIELGLMHVSSGLELNASVELASDAPELLIELAGNGPLSQPLRWPHPFATEPGDWLVIPMNEGISYPVEDASVELYRLVAYGGHGICMAFFGVTDGRRGVMGIFETPDDAAIKLNRKDGRLDISTEWDPQKQQWGYTRRLRYVFFADGGHVAMAKRYRQHAKKTGLLKTLAEKRLANPNVDLLVGAVNVWCWEKDSVALAREMQAAGIERILWSNRQTPENLKALNELNVLTSRYDIYQDLMDPAQFSRLRGVHSDWTTEGWPKDIMLNAAGDWIKGWQVETKDGQMIPCGVLCDKRAPDYAKRRIPAELATHPYRCRFIDTTTASPWRECYHPDHPMTRSESRHWKMELLRYVSEDCRLVTGSETGHEAAVPFLHYFEGMLSLGPYRVPDAGRRMSQIWTNVPPKVAQFQLGHRYRLPLWELVYHDCVIAQWYWGDYNNKLPALWDKRDLFNALYGTPPMFMFNRALWNQNKERFVQSYKATCPIARQVGYAEMIDHRFLTPNRDVQQTVFASGHVVTVNFGDKPYVLPDGTTLAPMSSRFTGPK